MLSSCLMIVGKQFSFLMQQYIVLVWASSLNNSRQLLLEERRSSRHKTTATGLSLMDGQPGAGDLNCPPYNEIKELISMTVCCSVTVCTEDYVPTIGLAAWPLREQARLGLSLVSFPLQHSEAN